MKKKIGKALLRMGVFLAVFFLAMAIAEGLMNRGNTDMTAEMGQATLPIVYMNVNDEYVNPLHGYTVDMEGSYLRGAITPLKANREVDILIDTYGAVISKVGYEVRSKDMQRLIEVTELESYSYENDMITATLPIKDLIEDEKEYMLVILITDGAGKVTKYYTRIINKPELYLTEKFSFVKDFSAKTFDREAAAELKVYMETNAEGDNSSYGYVNIHSNFRQLTWGDLQPIVSSEKELYLLEVDSLNACIELSYRVFVKNEYYNVKEYYRIRRGKDRMHLMEYERHMNQVFDEDKNVLVNGKILHGILDEKLQWAENKTANVYTFVQQNSLYSFNTNNNNLAKVFSFYDKDNNDLRTRYDAHGVKILSVDDGGNIMFLVYGYMNRGIHEGEVGACIYFYDAAVNTVEEEMFFPYTKSFQMLKQDMKALSYINARNMLYLLLDGCVYRINMDTKSVDTVAQGLDENRFVSSADNSMIAWQDGESLKDYDTIRFFSLNASSPVEIKAEPGEIIVPLGFMDSDLIYGRARLSDITTDMSGSTVVPMFALRIQNIHEGLLKEYQQAGIYTLGITVEENMITLDRVVWNEEIGFFEETKADQIMNNQSEGATKNRYTSVVTEEMETTYQTELARAPESNTVKKLSPKQVVFEGNRDIALSQEDLRELYYVYAMGEIIGIYADAAEAINRAEDAFGVVVDRRDSYIWQGGNRYLAKHLQGIEPQTADMRHTTTALCVTAMLQMQGIYPDVTTVVHDKTVIAALRENLEDAVALDLTGCSLDAVQYYVSCGYPVLAMIEADEAVLITGYDSGNTTIYDPKLGTIENREKQECINWFMENGNRFVSLINTKQ
ncbi:MAG: hypothetical protein IKS87_03040 [Lachnospiraceae bacterium]|nr:hypothetical protein [Lachnospiraceae bacterium]